MVDCTNDIQIWVSIVIQHFFRTLDCIFGWGSPMLELRMINKSVSTD